MTLLIVVVCCTVAGFVAYRFGYIRGYGQAVTWCETVVGEMFGEQNKPGKP